MVIFVSTMCVNSSWLDSSSSCLCARTKWWLMPSQKACCPQLSSGTAKSWLVMLLSPLAYYIASGALTLSASFFVIVFCLIVHIFPRLLRCVRGFWAAFNLFFPLLCLYFLLHVCTILFFFGLPNTVSLRPHHCAWMNTVKRNLGTRIPRESYATWQRLAKAFCQEPLCTASPTFATRFSQTPLSSPTFAILIWQRIWQKL